MKPILLFLLSVYMGYLFFLYFSHPEKKKHKVPRIRVGNIELMPNVKIHIGNRTYHLHHWLNLSVLVATTLFFFGGNQNVDVVRGIAFGGIIQGLRYPDRFKFRVPRK